MSIWETNLLEVGEKLRIVSFEARYLQDFDSDLDGEFG
jgi:hypothetical protein